MFRQAKTYRIEELTPEVVKSYYNLMESISKMYVVTAISQSVVLVVVMKTKDNGLSVDLSTTGESREFNELCKVYENLFTILGQNF